MKVLYLPDKTSLKFRKLTSGKVYDVIEVMYKGDEYMWRHLIIKNDQDEIDNFPYLSDFKDVTTEFRSSIIEDILF